MTTLSQRLTTLWRNPALHGVVSRQIVAGTVSVAAAAAVRFIVQEWSAAAPSYALFHVAIAAATWLAGWPAGLIATFLAALIVQPVVASLTATTLLPSSGPAFWLFAIEGALLTALVWTLRRRLDRAARLRQDADAEISRLQRREQDLRLIEHAFDAVAARARETACLILDLQARVARWNTAAERLYGYPAEWVLGQPWPSLGAPEGPGDAELRKLIQQATDAGEATEVNWARRADGGRFRAEATVTPLHSDRGTLRGFTVVVRDLTSEQASQEFRSQALATQEALQGEADALNEHLEAIQTVLAPELSDLAPDQLLRELLGRLLGGLHVDGVALIDAREPAQAYVITAPRGAQAQPRRGAARHLPQRLRIVQNDEARVRELGVAAWPEAMALVATAPIGRERQVFGALEVVTRRPRRWNERDALLLLLAADRASAALTASTAGAASVAASGDDRLSVRH